MLLTSSDDVLAYMSFPHEHWAQIHSTNPLARLNREIGRRADVVGIFPNRLAVLRRIAAHYDFANLGPGAPYSLHPDQHAAVFDPAGDLYFGNDGGVFEIPGAAGTISSKTQITDLNTNLDITQFYPGISSAGELTQLIGGNQDNGTVEYCATAPSSVSPCDANGVAWRQVFGSDGMETPIDPSAPQNVYADYAYGDVQYSRQYGHPARSPMYVRRPRVAGTGSRRSSSSPAGDRTTRPSTPAKAASGGRKTSGRRGGILREAPSARLRTDRCP